MSHAADAPLAADMDDTTLAAGLEDELSTIRPTGEEEDDNDDDDAEPADEPVADDADDAADLEDEDDDLDDEDDEPAADSGAAAASDGAAATDGAAPITRAEDGATWNDGAKRWQKDGKFVEGAPPEPPAVATTGAANAEAKPADTAQAGWTPFSVTVDREAVGIPEAQLSRANGHVILGIPEDKFPDFQRRIVRGVAAERTWRQLHDGVRQLEEERKAQAERPAIRSDSEVEADLLLEVLKPLAKDLLTEEQVENLALRVQIAQGDEKKKVAQWETDRTGKAEADRVEHEAVIGQLAESIIETVENADGTRKPEYAHLSDDDLREVMADMAKHSRGIISKNGDKYERNTSLVQFVLSNFAKAKAAATATKDAPAGAPAAPATPSGAPSGASSATPAKAGTTAAAAPAPGDRADKFNAAQGTAARPTTTSVKARRSAGTGRPASGRTTGEPRRPKDPRTPAQRAEDEHMKTTRAFLRSPTLEIEGGVD